MILPFTAHSPVNAFNQYMFSDGPVTRFWRVTATIIPQKREDWQALSGFLDILDGGRNKVRIHDLSRPGILGANSLLIAAVRDAALAGSDTIVVRSLDISTTAALKRGDHFSIGENLYRISNDVNTDANGHGSFNIKPDLRRGVAPYDPVNFNKPTSLFRLITEQDNFYPDIDGDGDISGPLTLSFIEDPDYDT